MMKNIIVGNMGILIIKINELSFSIADGHLLILHPKLILNKTYYSNQIGESLR